MSNKYLHIFILLAVLITSLVPLNVFADNNSSYEVLVNSDWPTNAYGDTINDYTFGIFDYTGSPAITNRYCYIFAQNTNQQYYYFLVYKDIATNRKGYELYVCADGVKANLNACFVRGSLGLSTVTRTLSNQSSYNSSYDISYSSFGSEDENYDNRQFTPGSVNVFNSLDDGLSALRDAIDNGTTGGGGAITPKFLSISIQPGTVAFVSVNGGQFTLKTTFEKKFSGGLLSSARYWYATSLPTGNFTVGNGNNIQPIVWTADGPFDMLRRTYNGILEVNNLSQGYYAIYNPIEGVSGNNNVIRAYFSDAVSVVQYPLNNTYEGHVLVGEGSDDNVYVADNAAIDEYGNAEYTHYDVDENGNTVTSSAISTPVGGLNIIDQEDSSLGGLVDRILYLLSAPIKHIQQLFNSGSDFMNWLGSLWSWLPEPVYIILTSALVVLMVIGVIKFLWK